MPLSLDENEYQNRDSDPQGHSDPIILSSIPKGADALQLLERASSASTGIMHIVLDDKRLEALSLQLKALDPTVNLIILPAWDCLPYDRVSPSLHISNIRTKTLCKLAFNEKIKKKEILLTTISSALGKLPPSSALKNVSLILSKGDNVQREDITNYLVRSGYINTPTANEAGEFSVRGSIIDIFPSGSEEGYRLDFFGNTIEQIRTFDPLTQVSGGYCKSFELYPSSEILFDETHIQRFRQHYRETFGAITSNDPLYAAISEGRHYAGMEHWLPLFYDKTETIFDYTKEVSISLDHLALEAKNERLAMIEDYYQARLASNHDSDHVRYHPLPPSRLYLSANEWDQHIHSQSAVIFSPFSEDEAEKPNRSDSQPLAPKSHYLPTPSFSIEAKTLQKNAFLLLQDYLVKHQSDPAFIACYSQGTRTRIALMCKELDIPTQEIANWKDRKKLKPYTIGLFILPIEKGFIATQGSNTAIIISEQDLLGPRLQIRTKARKSNEEFMKEVASLTEGELVIHKNHGLGRFEKLETLEVMGERHDFLLLIYDAGDKLYIPVENIDLLTRYGAEADAESNPRLDRLGGSSWTQRKEAFKKRIKDLAKELMKIAAKRALRTAARLLPMDGLHEEFCARFPYQETDDQLSAIEDVTNDLSSGHPMDRLICGDVGFGKTEVALRTAFIAASSDDHPQVAVIAPTTLLVRQHLMTFKERFADMPFEIEGLSRLTSSKDARRIKEGIKEGTVNIIIGTHALLAKSIEFKNLGLVIIDEEQLFGVKQKERLKQLRADVHLLSMSATPIPRTLQMSLAGIKDLSLIATPPVDRLSIRTYIMPFDPVVIRNAILREFYRGGRTFYVAPRIADLDLLSERLARLVPEVKVGRAHGQMSGKELDDVMNAFYDGKFDLLLSTNIVGSGIDLPQANTMLIHRADMFGLGQLYQMRGRVGRGKVRAYAYLTTPPGRILSTLAMRRLEVMQSLDGLGAGFNLASHDMDIRGSGNLLGEEQSGQIREVGVELYQEMLADAIAAAKAEKGVEAEQVSAAFTPQLNMGIAVLIPEEYIPDLTLRMGLYRRIASLHTPDELESIAAEMIDRFGALPIEVENLLSIMHIKQQCMKIGIEKIDAGPKGMVIRFYQNKVENPDALFTYIAKNPVAMKIKPDQSIVITTSLPSAAARLKGVQKQVHMMKEALCES